MVQVLLIFFRSDSVDTSSRQLQHMTVGTSFWQAQQRSAGTRFWKFQNHEPNKRQLTVGTSFSLRTWDTVLVQVPYSYNIWQLVQVSDKHNKGQSVWAFENFMNQTTDNWQLVQVSDNMRRPGQVSDSYNKG